MLKNMMLLVVIVRATAIGAVWAEVKVVLSGAAVIVVAVVVVAAPV